MRYEVKSLLTTNDTFWSLFMLVMSNCGLSGEAFKMLLTDQYSMGEIVAAYGRCWVNDSGEYADHTGSDFEDTLVYTVYGDMERYESMLKHNFGCLWTDVDDKFATVCREYYDVCHELTWQTINTYR